MKATLTFLSILLGVGCSISYAQIITTIAGTNMVSGYSGDGGPSTSAKLNFPRAVAVDNAGNVYIAEYFNHVIRKINSSGIITTVAGSGTPGSGGNGGPATSAKLYYPVGVAVDNAGNLYITETASSVVRKVNTSGIISIYAGTGVPGYSGDGGPANAARLTAPWNIAVDNANNLYILDGGNYTIRKVSPSGIISTFVGTGVLSSTGELAPDNSGNVYIADVIHHIVLKATIAGAVTTFAGNGTLGFSGDGGPAINAQLSSPSGVTTDNAGNVYIVDESYPTVRKIDPAGIITRFALTGGPGYYGDGGPALAAEMWIPEGIATDNAGHFYVADTYNHTVRKITACIPVIFNLQPFNISRCENSNAGFSVNSLNVDTYQWQVNDGSGWNNVTNGGVYSGATTNTLVISNAPVSMNNYQYRCAGSNTCSSNIYSSVAFLTVIPLQTPFVTIAVSPSDICSGATATVTTTVTNGGSGFVYQWQMNNGSGWNNVTNNSTYSGASTNTLTIGSAIASMNNYQYRCEASNACSNNYSSAVLLIVAATPTVTITASSANVCAGSAVTFTATNVNNTNPVYQWQVNDGTGWNNITDGSIYNGASTNTLTINQAVTSINNYQYRCQVTTVCGTYYSPAAPLTVTARPVPTVTIAGSANDVCSGTPVTFTATATNGGSKPLYQWQVNGVNAGTNSDTYTNANLAGGDMISCMLTSNLACTSPVASAGNIVMNIKPAPVVAVSADTTIKQGNSVQLNAAATGTINSYQWSPSGYLNDQNIPDPTTKPVNTTTYQVVATAANGCTGYGKVTITVIKKIVMPNAFTPNGDGKNDVFSIPPAIIFNLKNFSIFNRWGNLVYQTNDITKGWDGTVNGKPSDIGTYVYMISGTSQNEPVTLKGTVELLR